MPAQPPVPQVIKVVMDGNSAGIPIATVFHLGYSGPPPTGQTMLAVATAVMNGWENQIAPLVVNSCGWDQCTCTDLSSETGAQAIFEKSVVGGHAGPAVPNNVELVLSKAIGRRYRGGRPRTYLPGLPESDLLDPTHWTDSSAIAAGNSWSNMIAQIVGDSGLSNIIGEVVVHYVKNGTLLEFPLVDSIAGAVGRTLVGTLRRRLT